MDDAVSEATSYLLDIGPKTQKLWSGFIGSARTVTWDGLPGFAQVDTFQQGTTAVLEAIAAATQEGTKSFVVGHQLVAALDRLGLEKETDISAAFDCADVVHSGLTGGIFAAVEMLSENPAPQEVDNAEAGG